MSYEVNTESVFDPILSLLSSTGRRREELVVWFMAELRAWRMDESRDMRDSRWKKRLDRLIPL